MNKAGRWDSVTAGAAGKLGSAAKWSVLDERGRSAATFPGRSALMRKLNALLVLPRDLDPIAREQCEKAVRRGNMTLVARHRVTLHKALAELEAVWAVKDQELARREASIEERERAVANAEKALVARLAGVAA